MAAFLLWGDAGERDSGRSCHRVASALTDVFAPLFPKPQPCRTLRAGRVVATVLDLPLPGWRPPRIELDDRGWAFAVDPPTNAAAVVPHADHDGPSAGDSPLRMLCRRLQHEPTSTLRDLAPPFSLVWSDGEAGGVFVQTDGLGMSQLFEYARGSRWAVSNRIAAFAALGLPIEPDPQQWAVRAALGWFPSDTTGYRGIRFLPPGTRLRASDRGVSRTAHDVLGEWVRPGGRRPAAEWLELARASLLAHVRTAAESWERPEVGLTGGWDSRAVAASLRAAGIEFAATVRGLPGRRDVVIASELARAAGIELAVQNSGGLPPDDPAACRRSVSLALRWQAGHAAAHRHKTFLANRRGLKPRGVSVTGQHGEIGRRERAVFADDGARRLRAARPAPAEYEQAVMAELLADVPPFLRREHHDHVREAIADAYYGPAARYGLTGLSRVDLFILHEFTRRKGAGVHAWQPRLAVAPFLNPGFIRAVFGYPHRADPNAFHRHIIAANAPDWVDVPYFDDLAERGTSGPAEPASDPAGLSPIAAAWKRPMGRENYDGPLYWRTVGEPLVDAALERGGFWTEVFDPDLIRDHRHKGADLLTMLDLLPSAVTGPPR